MNKQKAQQLQKIAYQQLKQMYEDKKQSTKLLIPKNLPPFIKTSQFTNLLHSVYQYCDRFNQILKTYSTISSKMQGRIQQLAILLQKQKQQLGFLQRQISYHYSAILLKFNLQCNKIKKRSNFKDQVFFQALIYLISRIIKQMFNRQQFLQVQQQINRLFRTNRYNLIKKRHQNQQMLHKYPALKQIKNSKKNIANTLKKAFDRNQVFRKYQKDKKNLQLNDYTSTLGTIKQFDYPDMEQRSPLLCTWLPSRKSMLEEFSVYSVHNNNLLTINRKHINNALRMESQSYKKSRIAKLGNLIVNKVNTTQL